MKILKILAFVFIGIVVAIGIMMISFGLTPLSWGMHDSVFVKEEIAIGGYDPVSYFTENEAKLGKAEISGTWKESTWHFSSEENKNLFMANPHKYAPQGGGHCAFAISQGFTAPSDGAVWKIENNKLYLFSNSEVLDELPENLSAMVSDLEENWNE